MSEPVLVPKPIFCRHFSGRQNEKCLAGVLYADVEKKHDGILIQRRADGPARTVYLSLPCIQGHNVGGATCAKCDFPTAEELAAQEEKDRELSRRIMVARKSIVDFLGGKWNRGDPTVRDAITCPICGKEKALRFSRAGYNGHIHAACQTKDCVSWLE